MKKSLLSYLLNIGIMPEGTLFPRVLILITLLSLVSHCLYAKSLLITPLGLRFYGVVGVKDRIIVYGTNGHILVSDDYGRSWHTKPIGIADNIRKVINVNGTLWGLAEKGTILRSIDKGENWEKYPLGIVDTLLDFLFVKDKYVLRGIKTLYILDGSLSLIKSITSDTIEMYFSDCPCSRISWRDYYYKNIFEFNGDVLLNVRSPYIFKGICKLNLSSLELEFIKLSDKIKTWNPEQYYLAKILHLGETPIVQINYNLYYVDSTLSRWKYFFKDSTFLNWDDSIGRKKWSQNPPGFGDYFTYREQLLKATHFQKVFYKDNVAVGIIYGFKIAKYSSMPQDTFIEKGRGFTDTYLGGTMYPTCDGTGNVLDNFITLDKYSPLCFNDSVWIFTNYIGSCDYSRAILLSDFNLDTFRLVSFLGGQPIEILDDTTFFFVYSRVISLYHTEFGIYRTTDGGNTFTPILFLNEKKDTLRRTVEGFYQIYNFQTFEDGAGFLVGNTPTIDNNIVVTSDYWRTFDTTRPRFPRKWDDFPDSCFSTNFIKLPEGYYFILSNIRDFYLGKGFKAWHYFLDSSFKKINLLRTDSLLAVFHLTPINSNELLMFCIANDSSVLFKNYFEVRRTSNYGETFETLIKVPAEYEITQFYELNKDSILFTTRTPDALYLYDVERNNLKLLWAPENDEWRNPMLMVISDRFYLVGRELFLENTNRSDLTQWQEGKWDYGKPNFESVIFKGNVAIAGLSDSLRPFNYYKITLKKDTTTSVEDSQLDVRYYTTHFYATEPYPLPAHSIVRSKLYWDGSFDLVQAIDGVYDVMGNRVEGKQRITIKELGKATAELTWNCSGVPSGIYFIVVRHNGRADTIPVIVE